MRNLIGSQLGQYQLTEVIRRGGMATVYKAYQESLDRYVAVKVLFHSQDPQFVARFQREARAIAHLQHPNILPIFDSGEQDGLLYLVLQYVEQGMTLSDLVGQPMEPVPALRLMVHVLGALEYAHERGIVHRDIKPANILMPAPSWPMLADFGIAKLLTESDNPNLTAQGMIIGTAAYVAPEQVLGMPIDRRTDLYSAGIVLYEMITGRVPFDRGTPIVVATKQAYEAPPAPREINPDLPPVVEAVVLRALEKSPANRFQTAAEMATELERVARHLSRTGGRNDVSVLYRAGVGALEAGRWDEAILRLRQVVRLDPGYEDASELLEAAEAVQRQQQAAPAPPPQAAVAEPPAAEGVLTVPGLAPAPAAPPEEIVAPEAAPPEEVAAPEAAPPEELAPPEAAPPEELAPPEAAPPEELAAPDAAPEEVVTPEAPPEELVGPEAPPPAPPVAMAEAAPPVLSPPPEAAPPGEMVEAAPPGEIVEAAPPEAALAAVTDAAPVEAEIPVAMEETAPPDAAGPPVAEAAPEPAPPPAARRPRRAPRRAPRAVPPAEPPASAGVVPGPEIAPEAPVVPEPGPAGAPTMQAAEQPAPPVVAAPAAEVVPALEVPAAVAAPAALPLEAIAPTPEVPAALPVEAAAPPVEPAAARPGAEIQPADAEPEAMAPAPPAAAPAAEVPDLPPAPVAPLAWRAPDVPPVAAEPPGGAAAPVEPAPPPGPPAGVAPLVGPAAADAPPRRLEQAAPVPAAPAGQRRISPILIGAIVAVLLLLAGAAFLFRPPAPPAAPTPTTLPATLIVTVPSEAPATTAPALTAPPTEAAPATAATVVAAADTATAVPLTPTPSPVAGAAAPSPAGTRRLQTGFDLLPAIAPEYDAYASLSSSGLENDIDNLNTAGSTAGFQNPGTYRIALDGANQSRAVALARFAYSAFSVQIDLADASEAAAAGNLGQGVVVRERDHDHFYAVLLNARNGQYAVRKLDGADHWSDLVPWTASPLIHPRGTANQLRVDGAGDAFTVYLNDALLAHFSDGAYPSGMLGFIGTNLDATKSVFDFDNLSIWSSDPAGPAATLDANRGMIRIPGGEFIMGWYAKPDEQAHMVDVPNFYIDATEVTNKAYKQCVAAGKCTPPAAAAPSDPRPNYFQQAQFDSYPVVDVSWTQALAYCTWANKRLPTEAEWEKAASWDLATAAKAIWPWADNRYDPKRLTSGESNPDYTTAVRQFGPELNGTFDMAGNVREWTSSLKKAYPYNAADGREDLRAPGERVYRGGSWDQTWGKARTFARESAAPGFHANEIGFRCAATP